MKRFLRPAFFSTALLIVGVSLQAARVKGQDNSRPHPPILPPFDPPHVIFPPRPWPMPERGQELRLRSQEARVTIEGPLAKIHLTQHFENLTGARVEGTYLFPLPQGAAVSGFAMTMNGKRTEAEILEKDKAREIYEGIVAKMRDPAILEYTDRDLLRARIFPVEAGGKVAMELVYSQALRPQGSSFSLQIPQKLPVGGAPERSSVEVKLAVKDLKGLYSPSHKVNIEREGTGATVRGEWSTPDLAGRDFSLIYSAAGGKVGLSVTLYPSRGEDPYFLLLAAPDSSLSTQEVGAKDVVFVFDTSGSMEGEKIEQARKALSSILGNLNPGDRFNIVTFASDTNSFRDSLVPASSGNLASAKDFIGTIKAIGGTNINEALTTAFKMMDNKVAHPKQIVFLTDGQPTVGETVVDNIVKNGAAANVASARLFTFGVGYDVNSRLLDTLAEDNRGASDYVAPQEDIEEKVGALYAKIAFPVLTDPLINWENATAYDIYPRKTPDLFKGSQLVIFGRLRAAGKPGLTMSGQISGKTERIAGQVATTTQSDALVSKIWATRKVGFLLADARQNNRPISEEVKAEILKLSKRFGIVTPFTAGLITEDQPNNGPAAPSTMRRMHSVAPNSPLVGDLPAIGSIFKSRTSNYRDSTGPGGVAAARGAMELKETTQVQANAGIRTIEGKSFVQVDGTWTEVGLEAHLNSPVKTLKFASPDYFAAARKAPVSQWLSLGEKVAFFHEGSIWKIGP